MTSAMNMPRLNAPFVGMNFVGRALRRTAIMTAVDGLDALQDVGVNTNIDPTTSHESPDSRGLPARLPGGT
jgi:hypothetical protein